jgi:hypothetical protein
MGERVTVDDNTTKPPARVPAGWKALAILSLFVALAAVGAAGYLWSELDDLRETALQRDSRTNSDLSDAERRISSLERDVGYSVGFDSLTSQISGLDRELDALKRKIDQVDQGMPRSLEFELGLVASAVGDLRDCINDYMDTVARAGGGRYTYYWC